MRLRRLGRTGLQVSEISLGTVELGLDYGIAAAGEHLKPDESEAAALLHFALDQGVNLIDTARAYGSSERIIGKALKERRREYYLISKVQSQPGRPGDVRRLVEASLRDLQTEFIEVMMVHCRADEVVPGPDTICALQRLREHGKLGWLGASVYGVESAMACIRSGAFDCLEIAYSALDRRPEGGVLEAACREDVGIIARSVLLKGALTERYRLLPAGLDSLRHAVQALAEIAGSVKNLPAFAYRYVLSHTPPHSALAGTARKDELLACLEYAAVGALPDDCLQAARAIRLHEQRWLNPGNWPVE